MTITMPCPRCDAVVDAADENELVAKVQQHVREDHGLDHTLPAKHILARLRRYGAGPTSPETRRADAK